MKAIKKLQKALSKNYYKKFIVPINSTNELNNNSFSEVVIYRDRIYYELNLDVILEKIRKIRNSLKPLLLDARAEINLELAKRKTTQEKTDFLSYIIKFCQILNKQLEIDILIDNKQSNYYSVSGFNPNENSFKSLANKLLNKINNKPKPINKNEIEYDLWELDYFISKNKVIGYLPASLLAISNSFILEIEQLIFDIMSENKDNKIQWVGKVSQLGFIVSELINLEYIEVNLKSKGEINNSALARELKIILNYEGTPTSLAKYLSVNDEKNIEIKNKYIKNEYNLPHKDIVS